MWTARRLGCLIVVGISVGLFAGPGCSNQGEGQPCDTRADNGGNDDCADGLVCTPKTLLNGNSDVCCPPQGTPSSAIACSGGSAVDGGGAQPDANSSNPDTSSDASGEASSEASEGAASDAVSEGDGASAAETSTGGDSASDATSAGDAASGDGANNDGEADGASDAGGQ